MGAWMNSLVSPWHRDAHAANPTGPTSTTVARLSEFGPFDELADRAHQMYVEGFSERAVRACRVWMPMTRLAGDKATELFLRYVEGIALMELGRHHESVTVALDLLGELEDMADPMWRSKALALLAESSIQVKEISRAMDALAEATWLVESATPGSYIHLSASTAVAVAMRAAFLFEQADELMAGVALGEDLHVDLLVVQEQALLRVFWGTTLLVVGREKEAGPHLVRSAELAIGMRRIAELAEDPEMSARAEVIEAYALSRLGYSELAAARVNAAILRFRLRNELVETHLAHLVLGRAATEAGDYVEARLQLLAAFANADRASRDIWTADAVEALADLDVAEHGNHPAVDHWKRLAREALERVWVERDGRFTALQTRNQVRALIAETSRMGEAALLDPLTGLGNRRMMAGAVDMAQGDISVIFVDVDKFKQVNDVYSHAIGDEVLRRIAVILRTHCRADDVPVRYGGDEFVILVLDGGAAAEAVAERLVDAVRTAPWEQISAGLRVTVSVGVGRPVSAHGAVAAADTALYEAKRAGRDRVVVAL